MQKHFVTFLSPGTFVSETTERPIDSWDVEAAVKMAREIKERHGAVPYGFRFTTRTRGDDDLDSKVTDKSPIYYLGGKVQTRAEVEARNAPDEAILRSNMRSNGYDRIIVNTNSWRFTAPLEADDIVLDVDLKAA
jgi:hypothetical protein